MGKVKLAICLEDVIYQERLVRCLMNHYKEKYELHIFQRAEELAQIKDWPYQGCIFGESVAEDLELSKEQRRIALVLNAENKYQEVYKLMESLEVLIGGREVQPADGVSPKGDQENRVIGVCSFTLPHLQLPMATMLSGIYGAKWKTILLDLQANSGYYKEDRLQEQTLGMEDMLAMSMEDSFNKNRCLSAIGHDVAWDYIYPVRSIKGLAELNVQMIHKVVQFLTKELEYQVVLINMGEGIADMGEFAEICHQIYLLYPKGDTGCWREKNYVNEMERRGKDAVLHRIHRIELPSIIGTDRSWESLVEQWKWNSIGDYLRKVVWGADAGG